MSDRPCSECKHYNPATRFCAVAKVDIEPSSWAFPCSTFEEGGSEFARLQRENARLRSRLARVLRYAHAWSAHMGTGVWSRRFSVSGGGRR